MDALSIENVDTSERGQPISDFSSADIESYVDSASIALTTMPESAREEETKAKLVTPFIQALGWNKYDSRRVRLEYTDEKTESRPDYALFRNPGGSPDIVVEAKRIDNRLDDDESQLYNYVRVFDAEWGVLTNGQEFRIYHNGGGINKPRHMSTLTTDELVNSDVVKNLYFDSNQVPDPDIETDGKENEELEQLVELLRQIEPEYQEGIPVDAAKRQFIKSGLGEEQAEEKIKRLKQLGKAYAPKNGVLRLT